MGNFEQILTRIKDITGKKYNREIAELLKTNESTFGKWVSRNKIPYEQILNLCIENDYDIKYIFTGIRQNGILKNSNSNNKNITITGDNNKVSNIKSFDKKLEILEKFERLPEKRQDYYYHMISADILNMEE